MFSILYFQVFQRLEVSDFFIMRDLTTLDFYYRTAANLPQALESLYFRMSHALIDPLCLNLNYTLHSFLSQVKSTCYDKSVFGSAMNTFYFHLREYRLEVVIENVVR